MGALGATRGASHAEGVPRWGGGAGAPRVSSNLEDVQPLMVEEVESEIYIYIYIYIWMVEEVESEAVHGRMAGGHAALSAFMRVGSSD